MRNFLMLAIVILQTVSAEANDTLMFVNDLPVMRYEFEREMRRYKPQIVSRLRAEGMAIENSSFWQTPFAGKTPLQLLKEKAIEAIIRQKLQEQVLQQNGLWEFRTAVGFTVFLSRVNEQRRAAVNRGDVVYGPVNFSATGFYDHLFNSSVLQLMELMRAKKLSGDGELISCLQLKLTAQPLLINVEEFYGSCLSTVVLTAEIRLVDTFIRDGDPERL